MIRTGLIFAMLVASFSALAWSDADEVRWRTLNHELRCLVCQNQSIAESSAPLAEDLRKQTRQMIEAGQSDAEIRQYMTARYGDFVLYRPPLKPTTYLLWFGPVLLLLLAAGLLWRLMSRKTPLAEEQAADVQPRLQQALKELSDD